MKLFRTDRPLMPSWQLLTPSITLLKDNLWPVVYLSFIPGLLACMGLVLSGADNMSGPFAPGSTTTELTAREGLGLGLLLLGGLWSLLAYPGFLIMQLRAIDGQPVDSWQCFRDGLRRLLPLIGMSLLSAIAIGLGLILLIIPGLILLRGLYLGQYYVVTGQLGPVQALKRSYADSKPAAGWIWGLIGVELVLGLVASLLGEIPVIGYLLLLAVGLLYVFAPALRYKEVADGYTVPAVSDDNTDTRR